MTAIAGIRSSLSVIGNGQFVVYKEPLQYTGDHCRSLPPLPTYTVTGTVRRWWGEDEDIDRMGFYANGSGFSKCRNNFDSCHPVSEGPEHFKHEGYMFPKTLHQDLSMLRYSSSNTRRRVPRDATCAVFPRADASRIYSDGRYILSETTRRSIADNVTRLCRTTQYNRIYKDTSRFLLDKTRRDTQYQVEGPELDETPTCCHVHNHPNPCHHCWAGGYNKDFDARLAKYQSRLRDSTKLNCHKCPGNDWTPCNRCGNTVCKHKNHCHCIMGNKVVKSNDAGNVHAFKRFKHPCNVCVLNNVTVKCDESHEAENEAENETDAEYSERNQLEHRNIGTDSFGPWDENVDRDGADDQLIVANVDQIKLPLCRARMKLGDFTPDQVYITQEQRVENMVRPLSPSTRTPRNYWTLRNENNLRIPCMADVLGSPHRNDVHTRYHLEHQEPIPDLRDHRKYCRRVKFYGYNSSVYH